MKHSPLIPLVSMMAALATLGVLAMWIFTTPLFHLTNSGTKLVLCTADAKVCPDGTTLGRRGPRCDFPACPTTTKTYSVQQVPSGWVATALPQSGLTFQHPSDWSVTTAEGIVYRLTKNGQTFSVENTVVTPISVAEQLTANTTTLMALAEARKNILSDMDRAAVSVIVKRVTINGIPAVDVQDYLVRSIYLIYNKHEVEVTMPNFGNADDNAAVGTVFEGILQSLTVPSATTPNTATTPTVSTSTADWRTYSDVLHGFSFTYPSTFAALHPSEPDPSIWTTSSAAAVLGGGSISVEIKNGAYTPTKIMGLFGQVDAARVTAIKFGTRSGSMYLDGDAGCGGMNAITSYDATHLLDISFSDCDDGTGRTQLFTQTDLIKQIVGTVTFGKVNTISKRYTSTKLGVTFLYDKTYTVKEAADTIVVYNAATGDAAGGQSIRVMTKDPAETLSMAIQKDFLVGYPAADCFVNADTEPGIPATWTRATIAYPASSSTNDAPWAGADKCPAVYTTTNGIAYFTATTQKPTAYFFINIGQYVINGATTKDSWTDTIQVF